MPDLPRDEKKWPTYGHSGTANPDELRGMVRELNKEIDQASEQLDALYERRDEIKRALDDVEAD